MCWDVHEAIKSIWLIFYILIQYFSIQCIFLFNIDICYRIQHIPTCTVIMTYWFWQSISKTFQWNLFPLFRDPFFFHIHEFDLILRANTDILIYICIYNFPQIMDYCRLNLECQNFRSTALMEGIYATLYSHIQALKL